MKKFLSIFLSLVLIIFQIDTIKVSADTTYQSGGYTYSVSNSTAIITSYTGSGDITIPDKINGYTVTGIGDCALDGCNKLTSITVPSSITTIGNYAFTGCIGLTRITIPSSVTSIGDYIFTGCNKLTSVTIEGSIISIGNGVFEGCSSLTSITIPNSVTNIGNDAFYGCSKLTSITIPRGVIKIGDYAFSNCSSLTSITIPNSVTTIGYLAFFQCSSYLIIYYDNKAINFTNPWNGYKTVPYNIVSYNGNGNTGGTVPVDNNIYTNGSKAEILKNTSGLVKEGYNFSGWNTAADGSGISYPVDTIVSMSGADIILYAQWTKWTKELYTYSVSNSTAVITDYTGSGGDITVPDKINGYTVTGIGDNAFSACRKLTSITISSSVTSIGIGAFLDCSDLNSITIPSSVTSIGNDAFCGCSSLTRITIPNSITSIGYETFYDCIGLTSIIIPNSVKGIGDNAFYNCSSLTKITIPSSVKTISNHAFDQCSPNLIIYYNNKTINFTNPWNGYKTVAYNVVSYDGNGNTGGTVPVDDNIYTNESKANILENTGVVVKAGYEFSGWNTAADGSGISYPAGTIVPMNGADIILYAQWTKVLYTYSVSNSTAVITGYTGLEKDITIPNKINGYIVTSIGDKAFYNCSGLTSITMPSSITSIGDDAFYNCSSLTSMIIPSSVTSIGFDAFGCCRKLATITIPSSVINIGSYAFESCSCLTKIIIPSSVQSMGEDVFWNCSSKIIIYYDNKSIEFTNSFNRYKTVPYNILSYNGNGNTEGKVPVDNNIYTLDSKAVILKNTGNLVKTGYVFAGWNTAADGSGTSYPSDATVSINGEDIILYAQWAVSYKYTVFFDSNGGSEVTPVTNITSGTAITLPAAPIKAGYTFAGWNTAKDGSGTTFSEATSVNENEMIYAEWKFNYKYSISNSTAIITGYTGSEGDITIPNSIDGYIVTGIDNYVFQYCSSLTSITIPDKVTSIGNQAFYCCSKLTSITIPNSLTSIGDYAFSNCSKLTSITIPNGVTSIGDGAFSNCSNLTSITIPNSVKSIGYHMFSSCSSLASITIPSSVNNIGNNVFESCINLTSIIIPNSVTRICDGAFNNCSSNLIIYYDNKAIGFTNPWNGYKTVPYNIVSYNGNGNTEGTVPVDNKIYTNEFKTAVLFNAISLVKAGYTFTGWNTSADGSGTSYPANATVSMNGADIMLYAQWAVDPYASAVKGDFNADNVIDNKDLAILREALLSSNKDIRYDLNGDNKVNVNDYLRLTKMIINQPVTDNTNITGAFIDDNFRNAVYSLINKNSSSPILYSDVKNIQNLNLASMGIKDLNGLEYFTSLKSLYCSNNQLTRLNVSKNTALTALDFSYNKILGINVDNNTVLTYLDCSNNQLKALDVSKNVQLIYLNSSYNKLTALNTNSNTALTYLDCSINNITALDVGKNVQLIYLNSSYNKLTALNTNSNTALTYLGCSINNITALDVSKNTALTYLSCASNQLTSLDVSKNTALNYLSCEKNQLTTLYSTKDTWNTIFYKMQYTDSTLGAYTGISITIKN